MVPRAGGNGTKRKNSTQEAERDAEMYNISSELHRRLRNALLHPDAKHGDCVKKKNRNSKRSQFGSRNNPRIAGDSIYLSSLNGIAKLHVKQKQ
jgi:hypothetical protein